MKRIYTGLESGGKSLKLAMDSIKCLERNAKWAKITGHPRPIISNMSYTPKFFELASKNAIPVLTWKDLEELPNLTDAYLFFD